MRKETTEEKGTVVYMDKNDTCYGGVMYSTKRTKECGEFWRGLLNIKLPKESK